MVLTMIVLNMVYMSHVYLLQINYIEELLDSEQQKEVGEYVSYLHAMQVNII